ncbi:Sodium - Bile acid symporter [Marinobacterium lacunae]|uniref:Sodium-Bile acid symporter n=1 Tax=Marinobacterium lacunae TaxID=1232683 RepID=A0A081FZK9_9GAMM|nr:bile acid:sodium symporter [Marinobacterium lacunae]KEA63964.1 Sodium - Bile acid symporter [Marinobacterium lacunae]
MKALILPLGLGLAFLLAWLEPEWGRTLKQAGLIPWLVMLIFMVNGYQVRLAEIPRELSFLKGLVATTVISLLLGPWLALYSAELLALPAGALLGLVVMGTVPSTLSSCIVQTQLAGGYAVWALLFSMALNIAGVFSMPLMLTLVLQESAQFQVDPWPLLRQLGLMVLLPFLVGVTLQQRLPFSPDARPLQYLPSICIVVGVWLALSDSASLFHHLDPLLLLKIGLAALVLHLLLFVGNWWTGRLLRIDRPGCIAMALSGSQKTLPVAISVLALLDGSVGEALLVCVLFHFLILFADALIAPRLSATPVRAASSGA